MDDSICSEEGLRPIPDGLYRTVYAAESVLPCLVELLAQHRPDPYLVVDIDDIEEDDSDADQWLVNSIAGSARLSGRYVDITAAETVAALHPLFQGKALA